MIYYRAVVEDNKHPEFNGKVRVRILGIHTKNNENSGEDFNFVSKDDLPWAEVLQPLEFGYNSGIGKSFVPSNGTLVMVMLENGSINKPIIIGALGGKPTKDSAGIYSGGEGFCDPDEKFPLNDRLDEFDINRLARVEKLADTIHQTIIDEKDIVESTDDISGADVTMEEPDSLNDKSVYPDVNVTETKSGHVIEIDDTTEESGEGAVNNERIRIYHKSGSYFELRPDGSIINKSAADVDADGNDSINHYIHYSDVHEHIKKSVKKYVELNVDEIIGGYVKRHIIGTLDEHITGDINKINDANVTEETTGDVTVTNSGTTTLTHTGAETRTGGSGDLTYDGLKIAGGGKISMSAGTIQLN